MLLKERKEVLEKRFEPKVEQEPINKEDKKSSE